LVLLGDVSLSGEDKPASIPNTIPGLHISAGAPSSAQSPPVDHEPTKSPDNNQGHDVQEHHSWLLGSTAARYLLAGGIAGAGEPAVPRIWF
jgi:solute carrier family 25 (mitochondrial phosphate transporter), member 23/24/25/41